ncbi:ribose 5-phosphate isomerase B [Candidatus Babeliales bacterium]|nr:ribose 5-phosphate isomerase B [Candidatus Babeliales bacterium]
MKITIGSDHRGYDLKEKIKNNFIKIEWIDVGINSKTRVDYPIFSKKVCKNILDGIVDQGILICGSGIGMSISANRFRGIYAALCWNAKVAAAAKEHDKANILVLSSDFVSQNDTFEIVKSWIESKFQGGQHLDRLKLIDEE